MEFKRIKLGVITLFISLMSSYGQVTVGSGSEPVRGTLLNLKQDNNIGENSDSGLLLPRVNLETRADLYPMFEPDDPLYSENEKIIHAGLIVYNLTTDETEDLCPGPYVWDGDMWNRLWEPCISPISIECNDIHTTGYVGIDMSTTPATSVAKIPYTLAEGSYELRAGNIGTYGDITAYVEAQTLTAPEGYITVKFSGSSATALHDVPIPIKIAGNTCTIYLSVIKPPADCLDGTSARAFVFRQDSKWYVVALRGTLYQGFKVAETIECDSEEEALSHPEALQYCGTQTTKRCIKLFDRDGIHAGNVYVIQNSTGWADPIASGGMGCHASIIAYSGSRIESTSYLVGYLGAIKVVSGAGYLGITDRVATLTTNNLR